MENEEYGIVLKLLTGQFKGAMKDISQSFSSWGKQMQNEATANADDIARKYKDSIVQLSQYSKELGSPLSKVFEGFNVQVFEDGRVSIEKMNDAAKEYKHTQEEINEEQNKNFTPDFWTKATKNAKRFALSLFGIHSVWRLISRATSSYLAQDEQLNARIKNLTNILGNALAPAIKVVVDIAEYAFIVMSKLIQLFTGWNILEATTNKNLDKTTKSAKAATKALAGFDTLTTLSDSSSGVGGLGNSVDAMEEFQKKVAEVDKIFKEYAPEITAASVALGLFIGTGMLSKIATFTGATGLGGILTSLGLISAASAIIITCTIIGYEQVKELQGFLDKMSSAEQQKANQKMRNQLTKIADITRTQRVNAKATLELWQDSQNPLYQMLGLSEGILENIEGQVKGASDTAKKYKDIIANQQISKEEAQQIYDAVKDQLQVNLTLYETYKKQGKETGDIEQSTARHLSVLNQLNEKYEIVDGKVKSIKNNTAQLNDIKLKDKDMTINVNGNTKDLENKSNNWFRTFTTGIANWLNTNLSSSALGSLVNAGKKILGSVIKFDVGTNYVPNDMLAMVHKGEMIVPKKYNPSAGGTGLGNEEVVALLTQLNDTLENKQFNGYISSREIGETATNYINNQSRIMGRSVVR